MASNPPTDAQRLAAALEKVAAGQHGLTTELAAVDRRRAEQISGVEQVVRKVGRVSVGALAALGIVAATLVVILSALFPGVPVLRIHESNERQTANVIRQLNCGVMWANGTRLSGCEDVFKALDAKARREGVSIPGS